MNYQNPELIRRLGAEYVLGTLRGPARRRFQRLMSGCADTRAEVGFWELRLNEFAQVTHPIEPPPQTREQLRAFIERTPAVHTKKPDVAAPIARRRFISARRRYIGLAAAASLVLVFSIDQRHSSPLPSVPLTAHATTNTWHADASPELPMYVTALKMPASSMQWLISITPDHRQLTVVAADDYTQLGRYSVELWWISPKRGPVPLGVLPSSRDATASIAVPKDLARQARVTFTISLEPQGGSPTGRPTGPVMDTAPDLGAI